MPRFIFCENVAPSADFDRGQTVSRVVSGLGGRDLRKRLVACRCSLGQDRWQEVDSRPTLANVGYLAGNLSLCRPAIAADKSQTFSAPMSAM